MTASAIAAVLVGSPAAAGVRQVSPAPHSAPTHRPRASTGSRAPSRPDRTDWAKIKTAASLRRLALARHRTARFRAFAASLGLRELSSIHRLAPGQCRTAVIDLYNNLLDLDNAYPGERWGPLRRAVAKEPSIYACAPPAPRRHGP